MSQNVPSRFCPTCSARYPAEFNVCPRDATQLEEVDVGKDDLLGTTLAQTYRLDRIIGEGGMGRVYEAKHNRISSKRYAIKVLHPEFARQPDVLARFQREAEASAAIDSPFVVDTYDVHRTGDGRPYIVGEYLEGIELAEHLQKNGRQGVAIAVRVTRQICKGLMVAHEAGVIHRDMKPENVFLTGDIARPIVKIIDFGISKLKDAPGQTLTKTGMIIGTPSYMSPEQARGDAVDHRADVYAAGAILYCMLTGRRPFDRMDPTATLTAVLTEDPERPRVLEPGIPEGLELVIQRAMSKEADDRYQSMSELDTDLALFDTRDGTESDTSIDRPTSGAISHHMPPPSFEQRRDAAANLDRQLRDLSMARPAIVVFLPLAVLGAFGALVTLVAAATRVARGGTPLAVVSEIESYLMLGAVGFALLTPLVLSIRHIARDIWPKSARAVAFAERLRGPVIAGLVAYGFGALVVRTIESAILRRPVGVAWPVWDLALAGLGLVAALFGLWFSRSKR